MHGVHDADVVRFLKLFTEVSLEEIAVMEKWEGADLNKAKIILADEATKLLHGETCLAKIHATTQTLFAGASGSTDLSSLPRFQLDSNEGLAARGAGISVVDLLIKAELAASKGEAKRLIKAGGARVNDEKVADEAALVTTSGFKDGQLKLSSGKKTHVLIVL